MISPWELSSLFLLYILYLIVVVPLLLYKAVLLVKLNKRGSVAAGDRANVERCNLYTLSTSLPSTSMNGRSTAGVADSKYIRVLILIKC